MDRHLKKRAQESVEMLRAMAIAETWDWWASVLVAVPANSAMTVNEVRESIGLQKLPGPEGDLCVAKRDW